MNQLSILCVTMGLFVLSACAPKTQEVIATPSSDVTKREFKAFWIGSSKSGSQNTKKGLMTWEDCYLTNTNASLEKSETGTYEILSYDFSDNFIWCDTIDHFNYEEGHLYKVHGTFTFKKNVFSGIYVDEVLSKGEDVHYQKVEIFDMYIGPEVIEGVSFHGQKIPCHQVKYSNDPRSGDWESYC